MTINSSHQPPPPILTGLYVIVYARVAESIIFEQRYTLSVEGRPLDRVPGVAICQDFDSLEFSVQYCDGDWEPIAISGGHASVEEAKSGVERSYPGINAHWNGACVAFEAAREIHEAELREGACSFCGKTPLQVSAMFGEGSRICGDCVTTFHAQIHDAEDSL